MDATHPRITQDVINAIINDSDHSFVRSMRIIQARTPVIV